MKDILTDFETSKKLKELGFNDECEYCYDHKGELWNKPFEIYLWDEHEQKGFVDAYTLEQIIKKVPYELKIEGDKYFFDLDHREIGYTTCHHLEETKYKFNTEKNFDNLATTTAKLFIKLKEDKLI